MQHLQDTDIITMVLSGQQKAYSILVERYQSFVFTVAMRYVENRETAEELAQDVFVKAYRSLSDFKGASKFSTWLYTITHYTCLSFLKKKKSPVTSIEQIGDTSRIFSSVETISDNLESKSKQALINAAIKKLNETDAEIIVLFYQAEQSLEEIASITGQTANTVKVRLFRARQKLKDILETQFAHDITSLKHH